MSDHFDFIIAAFAVAGVVVAVMVFTIMRDYSVVRRALAQMNALASDDDVKEQ
jgi:hypothetical protein